MKKVIIALAFVTSLVVTSCGSSETGTAIQSADSTACSAPTCTVSVTDTVKATNDTIK